MGLHIDRRLFGTESFTLSSRLMAGSVGVPLSEVMDGNRCMISRYNKAIVLSPLVGTKCRLSFKFASFASPPKSGQTTHPLPPVGWE